MSINYRHLSKAGSRIINQINDTTKLTGKINATQLSKNLPPFLRTDLPTVPEDRQYKDEKDWVFLPGDRVVIMNGECRGNIARVRSHNKETNSYLLDDNGPSRRVAVPKFYWEEGQTTHVVSMPTPVLKRDLRLVADIDDPDNPGRVKTVAVENVTFKGKYYDENYRKMMPYRCVYVQPDLIIPWPKPEEPEEGSLSTSGEAAREQTFWVDTIVKNTIPEKAFLTIRNPHSKYRRGKLTGRDIRKLVAPDMPLTETKKAYLAEKEMLRSRPKPELTEEDKIAIGEKVLEHLRNTREEVVQSQGA